LNEKTDDSQAPELLEERPGMTAYAQLEKQMDDGKSLEEAERDQEV